MQRNEADRILCDTIANVAIARLTIERHLTGAGDADLPTAGNMLGDALSALNNQLTLRRMSASSAAPNPTDRDLFEQMLTMRRQLDTTDERLTLMLDAIAYLQRLVEDVRHQIDTSPTKNRGPRPVISAAPFVRTAAQHDQDVTTVLFVLTKHAVRTSFANVVASEIVEALEESWKA